VSDAVLELWARILDRVDGARLLVHAQPGRATARIMDALTSRGATADQIEVVGHQANDAYLETYHRIDVVLDTYPYNGGTTTLDALWMGVPVVTLVGPTAGGRAGLSLATNLGHPELVATTGEGYVQLAAQLAGDPARLTALRAGMRERMRASPLMDGPRFAASVEAAYATMWREKVGGA
jgi:predicted O-linked N-acetylglucosamine transferase (SPINDLY family)